VFLPVAYVGISKGGVEVGKVWITGYWGSGGSSCRRLGVWRLRYWPEASCRRLGLGAKPPAAEENLQF